ncbi:fluoride efflux transporter CrcB [Aquimarina sp. AD10]|uniref:Fluoride-specific ion channel FluC n=1 Tax=Aquimarina aggregata TaxID=1642818 RepID=A0A163AVA5_9FLAO|nr:MULTISPECIES: fluoride efflux transporter CrcB [Aquimarina]AXT63764.1 fluoride efflux transporter CrcB [Aquimarina sp. AD10]KZS40831.1 protein CrcB [Aquimarina aggregata]RKN00801.1 fluoride efflux transporter CrcB [Aquimarina sp. AD10]
MKQILLVFLGGGTGSIARYLISKYLNSTASNIPYGTFTANVLGSLIIGIILGLAVKNNSVSQNTVAFLATGFCGGFTTFSTFAHENHLFLKSGDFVNFIIYAIGSFAIGLLFVFLGMFITK